MAKAIPARDPSHPFVGGTSTYPQGPITADQIPSDTSVDWSNITSIPSPGLVGTLPIVVTGNLSSGTLAVSHADSGITPGTYGDGTHFPNFTVDIFGHITAASQVAVPTPPVTSVFGRTGAVVAASGDYSVGQVTGAAPLASPTFTGTPAAPTNPTATDSSTQIATDAFVQAAIAAIGNNLAVVTINSNYTMTGNEDVIIVTTASGFPTITAQTASSRKKPLYCLMAVGTYGTIVANTQALYFEPANGTDTVNGKTKGSLSDCSSNCQKILNQGWGIAILLSDQNGNWYVKYPSVDNNGLPVNISSGVTFSGSVAFVTAGSPPQFQDQPTSWGGNGARATFLPLGRVYPFTPSSSSDGSGVVGDIAFDSNFLYISTGATQGLGSTAWRRVAISSF